MKAFFIHQQQVSCGSNTQKTSSRFLGLLSAINHTHAQYVRVVSVVFSVFRLNVLIIAWFLLLKLPSNLFFGENSFTGWLLLSGYPIIKQKKQKRASKKCIIIAHSLFSSEMLRFLPEVWFVKSLFAKHKLYIKNHFLPLILYSSQEIRREESNLLDEN